MAWEERWKVMLCDGLYTSIFHMPMHFMYIITYGIVSAKACFFQDFNFFLLDILEV